MVVMHGVVIQAKADEDGNRSNKMNCRHYPTAELCSYINDTAWVMPLAVDRDGRKAMATVWFDAKPAADRCVIKLNDSLMNGVRVTAVYKFNENYRMDTYQDSDWITILGIDESVNEEMIKKHIAEHGGNDEEVIRVCGIGGYQYNKDKTENKEKLQTTETETEKKKKKKRQFMPVVDVECVDHECAKQWVKALRLTELNGHKLWVEHRPDAVFENGGYLPNWARKDKLSINKYMELTKLNGGKIKMEDKEKWKKQKLQKRLERQRLKAIKSKAKESGVKKGMNEEETKKKDTKERKKKRKIQRYGPPSADRNESDESDDDGESGYKQNVIINRGKVAPRGRDALPPGFTLYDHEVHSKWDKFKNRKGPRRGKPQEGRGRGRKRGRGRGRGRGRSTVPGWRSKGYATMDASFQESYNRWESVMNSLS